MSTTSTIGSEKVLNSNSLSPDPQLPMCRTGAALTTELIG